MSCCARANAATQHAKDTSGGERAPQARRRTSAPAVAGNQAHLRRLMAGGRPLQAKLTIGAVNDPLEHEADAAADRVMRMADPPVSLSSTEPALNRKCAACEEQDKGVQREAAGGDGVAGAQAPPVVGQVLGSPGRALDPATHAFMASRFGADFGDVRIHTDAQAAQSAAAVEARAFTVGRNVVFGAGQYDPASTDGRRLLAHELAHTLQQDGDGLKRAPCRSAAQCAAPTAGDTSGFGTRIAPVQQAQTDAINNAPPASPLAAQRDLIGAPTPNIAAVMAANGLALRTEVFGIFLSPAIEGTVSAQTSPCSQFPDGSPAGRAIHTNNAVANKSCIEVPPSLETLAGTVIGFTAPGTPQERANRAEVLATITHEMEHAHFDATQSPTITAPADCALNMVARQNPRFPAEDHFRVEFFLSEIAAIASEFPTWFDNFIANNNPTDHRMLFNEELNQAFNSDEGIVGSIQGLQCACSCDSVNALVTQSINLAMTGWTPRQRTAFLRAMTRIMPSFWPPALVTPDGPS
ncbi:MAG TPA: DUF4157 domain-containing protein [Caulobacteraceae bacterium]|jgi:hypothetical protein